MNVETQVNYSLGISHSLSLWWDCNSRGCSLSPSRPGAWCLLVGPLQNCSIPRTATLLSQFPKWSVRVSQEPSPRLDIAPGTNQGPHLLERWVCIFSVRFTYEVTNFCPWCFFCKENFPNPSFSTPSFGLFIPQDFAWLPNFTESGVLPLTLMLAPSTALNSLSPTLHWAPPWRGLVLFLFDPLGVKQDWSHKHQWIGGGRAGGGWKKEATFWCSHIWEVTQPGIWVNLEVSQTPYFQDKTTSIYFTITLHVSSCKTAVCLLYGSTYSGTQVKEASSVWATLILSAEVMSKRLTRTTHLELLLRHIICQVCLYYIGQNNGKAQSRWMGEIASTPSGNL